MEIYQFVITGRKIISVYVYTCGEQKKNGQRQGNNTKT